MQLRIEAPLGHRLLKISHIFIFSTAKPNTIIPSRKLAQWFFVLVYKVLVERCVGKLRLVAYLRQTQPLLDVQLRNYWHILQILHRVKILIRRFRFGQTFQKVTYFFESPADLELCLRYPLLNDLYAKVATAVRYLTFFNLCLDFRKSVIELVLSLTSLEILYLQSF